MAWYMMQPNFKGQERYITEKRYNGKYITRRYIMEKYISRNNASICWKSCLI